jgi:starch phosphorylase
LLDGGLGPSWREGDREDPAWERLDAILDAALWAAHRAAKERLIASARARYQARATRQASEEEVRRAPLLLDPDRLLVGFARRFAPTTGHPDLRDREQLRGLLGMRTGGAVPVCGNYPRTRRN